MSVSDDELPQEYKDNGITIAMPSQIECWNRSQETDDDEDPEVLTRPINSPINSISAPKNSSSAYSNCCDCCDGGKFLANCLEVFYSFLEKTWDLLLLVAEGQLVTYCYHDIWAWFCIILPFIWVALRVTMEILKDETADSVEIFRYFMIFFASVFVIWNRENMFEEFYWKRFLGGKRGNVTACRCCCIKEGDESKWDTARREICNGDMLSNCRKNPICQKEKRVSTERTLNGLMMFLGALVLTSILWQTGLHYKDGNCLQDAYCELEQQWLVKMTQCLELILYTVLVIQTFAVGFQLLQFLFWVKLLLWTLKNMLLLHADLKEDSLGKVVRNTTETPLPAGVVEESHDESPNFWKTLVEKYPQFLWERTEIHMCEASVFEDEALLESRVKQNINLEKIYDFHQYVSQWMRNKPGKYYFNSIFIVSTISLSILIFIQFYNIISRADFGNSDELVPLILGTFLFMFIMSKMAAVNTLGSEVLKLYSQLALEIIDKELSCEDENKQFLDPNPDDNDRTCVVELITQALRKDHSESSASKKMAITQATLKQLKEIELSIPLLFPSSSCMCFQFTVRQTHINSLLLAIVGPVTGLIISTYVAPALKLS